MESISDFWNLAFGGKERLKLFLGATDFRVRRNKQSITASFNYDEGRIIINIIQGRGYDCYTLSKYGKSKTTILDDWLTTPAIGLVPHCVEQLTGKVLEF